MNKVRFGIVGLGRLGLQHAKNIAFRSPNSELVAACAMEKDTLQNLKQNWGVQFVYDNYENMLHNKEIDAIFVCSPSGLHCSQVEMALNKGLHVLTEKPLGTTVAECKVAEKAVEAHPDKVFMIAFMRRFDPSYKFVKQKVDNSELGRPILLRAYGQDPEHAIEGAIAYAPHSGGHFIDMAVHEIDLARWLLKSEPKTVYAIGGCYAHPEFGKYKDGDNVSALLKFENDAMAFFFLGRTAPHGYNVETELIGTKKTFRIASVPQKNLVEILDNRGVRKECSQDFLERFDEAYYKELKEFVECILEQRKPQITVYDGTRVSEIAYKCKQAFETGELVHF